MGWREAGAEQKEGEEEGRQGLSHVHLLGCCEEWDFIPRVRHSHYKVE